MIIVCSSLEKSLNLIFAKRYLVKNLTSFDQNTEKSPYSVPLKAKDKKEKYSLGFGQ